MKQRKYNAMLDMYETVEVPDPPGRKRNKGKNHSPADNPKNEKAENLVIADRKEPSLFERVIDYIQSRWDLQYNVVANKIECRVRGENQFKSINEDDIYIEIRSNNIKISQSDLKALLRSSFVKPIDPIQEYFLNLPEWDNTDHITKLANYIQAITQEEQEQFNHHFKKHLVRNVACALDEGEVNKHCLVLISEKQHKGKSSYIRNLVPKALSAYKTEKVNPSDKDGLIALSENFIINLDELQELPKHDIDTLKSYFSLDRIKIRRPYATNAELFPRRASFYGSHNNQEFLTDQTGSVRWLCFELNDINFNYSQDIDINKVWAQAYHLWKNDKYKSYRLTPDEIEQNELRNKIHQQTPIELELIRELISPGTKEDHTHFLPTAKIMIELQGQYGLPRQPRDKIIGNALKMLGFERKSLRVPGSSHPKKGYYCKLNPKKHLIYPTTDYNSP